jgi:hypothetical protein
MRNFCLILLWFIYFLVWCSCYAVAPMPRYEPICTSIINPYIDWYVLITAYEAFKPVHIAENNECLKWYAFLVPETANFKEILFIYDYDYKTQIHHPKIDVEWSFELWEMISSCSNSDCIHYRAEDSRTDRYKIVKDWDWWYKLDIVYSKTWINIKNFYSYIFFLIWIGLLIITCVLLLISFLVNLIKKLFHKHYTE